VAAVELCWVGMVEVYLFYDCLFVCLLLEAGQELKLVTRMSRERKEAIEHVKVVTAGGVDAGTQSRAPKRCNLKSKGVFVC